MKTVVNVGAGTICSNLPECAKEKIKKDLSFPNPVYVSALKRGAFIGADTPARINLFDIDYEEGDEEGDYWIPRGYVYWLLKFLRTVEQPYTVEDCTLLLKPINLKFKGELREYQEKARIQMMKYPVGVLEAATGGGKTIIALSLIASRKQPTLIIVHSKELLYQWRDQIKKFLDVDCGLVGDGKFNIKPITVGIIKTVNNKLKLLTKHFGHVVMDECFVKGTLIDGVPIEQIKVGDYVNSFNHSTNTIGKKKVLRLYKNPVRDALARVKLKNKKTFACTPDHPIFNGKDYLTTSSFDDSCSMLNIEQHEYKKGEEDGKETKTPGFLCNLSETCSLRKWGKGTFSEKFRSIQKRCRKVFRKMYKGGFEERKTEIRRMVEQLQLQVCQQKDEREQPYAYARNNRKGKICKKGKGNFTHMERKERRQWTNNITTGENSNSTWMGNGNTNPDSRSFANGTTKRMECEEKSSNTLQSGCGECSIEDSNRNRWGQSQTSSFQGTGQEENIPFKMERVESVKIYERGSGPEFAEMCPDGFVYNIEVEDNHNYFVEGVLVHNCHRIVATSWAETIQDFPAKYYLGLTATPFRSDGLGHAIFASVGPKIHKVDKKMLLDTGAVLRPTVHRIETDFRYVFANDYSTMLSKLSQDENRINLVCKNIAKDIKNNKENVLVVSDRKTHCMRMRDVLEKDYGIKGLVLTGTGKKKEREDIVKKVKAGKCKALFATAPIITEGFDAPNLNALFITTPVKFNGRLIQMCGRILRPSPGKTPRIFDFRDNNVDLLKYSGYGRDRIFEKEWK